jgi:hypothetical protein
MPENYLDQASRYLATLDPPAFLGWLLGLAPHEFAFRGWLDTRGVPFPGDPDRVSDTVARVADLTAHGVPWVVAIEFQTEPDADMFGRLLGYLSGVWLSRRPDDERGSRYHLGAAVVNLTGRGRAGRDMHWPAAGLRTLLTPVERHLEHELADTLLTALEGGRWSACLLPWVALMAGADDAALIDRWKALATAEPDAGRRSQLGALARLFARRTGRGTIWDKKLEGWNVEESTFVNEWIAKGEKRGIEIGGLEEARASVLRFGTRKFGTPPNDAAKVAVAAITDRGRLERMQDRLFDGTATGWDDLLATA